jgi:hypothetical protein
MAKYEFPGNILKALNAHQKHLQTEVSMGIA